MPEPVRREIGASSWDKPGATGSESTFEPLRTLPADVPKDHRRYWKKLAAQARTSYMAAIQLKCLDCAAWDRPEAARCEIAGCPLWAFNRRIFGRRRVTDAEPEGQSQRGDQLAVRRDKAVPALRDGEAAYNAPADREEPLADARQGNPPDEERGR